MTQVGLLTINEKNMIIGQQYAPDSYFNPIQDINDNWVISIEEIEFCINIEFLWVKDLSLITYIEKK